MTWARLPVGSCHCTDIALDNAAKKEHGHSGALLKICIHARFCLKEVASSIYADRFVNYSGKPRCHHMRIK